MSDGNSWMYAVMAAAGVAVPVMAAMSAGVGQKVGAPTSAAIVFASAALAAAVYGHAIGGLRFDAIGAAVAPALAGGVLIAFYLVSISTLGPKIGIGTAIFLVLLGQIASAVVIDTFGLFGAPRTPVSGTRLLGIVLMVAGVALARRPID